MNAVRARVAIGIAALVSALLAAGVGAAGDTRVLLVGGSTTDPTLVRVKQELTLLGLDVEVTTDPTSDLAAAARAHGAAAVARVEAAPPEIVLWVDGAHSGGTPQESRVSESLTGHADAGLLALRAVELLRGRLIPVPVVAPPDTALPDATAVPTASVTATPTASAAVTAAPSATATARPAPSVTARPVASVTVRPEGTTLVPVSRPSGGSVHLGPAFLASPGGVPAAPALRFGGGWRVASPIEVDAVAIVPLSGATVAASEGAVDLRVLAVAAGASLHLTSAASLLALRAGGGIGFAGFFYEGRASAPWVARSGSGWAALPYVEAGAGYRFTPFLGVRADLLVALARPEPAIRIADETVASFGSPLILGSIALEVHP